MEESIMTEENKQIETDEQVETTENTQEEKQDNTTYSQSEVDRQISKAVESAIQKQRAKWEEEKQQEIEQAKDEAAEYAKMTQKEKEEAEFKKRLEELERREKELNNRQLLNEIESDLKENELPIALADALLALQDNEKIKNKISDIKKHVDEQVNVRVKEALRQDTPNEGTKELSSDPFTAKLAKYK